MIVGMQIRQGSKSDEGWLYQLYCATMRVHIEKTWGWDEQFQRNGFIKHLSPEKFKIVVVKGNDAGAYLVTEEEDHFWLEMLLISPTNQNQGIGIRIINRLKNESRKSHKPLKLSVIKVNPAKQFYLRLGFEVYEQDDAFYKMEWVYSKAIESS